MTSKAFGLAQLGNVYNDGALSNRNLIINGAMQVNQRGVGATVVTSFQYLVDRFFSQNTSGTGTMTAEPSTLGNEKSLKMTATAAITDLTTSKVLRSIAHKVESQNIYHLNGKAVTISFTVETNWSGNLSVALRNYAQDRSYVADVAVVSGVNNVSVTLTLESGTTNSNDNSQGPELTIGGNAEGTFQTSSPNTWVAANVVASTSSTQWSKTIGNFINITGVQLEVGDTATPFEHRSYGQELALCQRYYQEYSYSEGGGVGTKYGVGVIVNRFNSAMTYPTTMRAGPTFTQLSAPTLTRCTEGSHTVTLNDIGLRVDCTSSGDYRMYGGLFSLDAEL